MHDVVSAAADDLSPQAPTVAETFLDALDGKPLQMATGLAKTKTAQDHLADTELATDKMVERHAVRYEVASGGARLQSNLAFSGQGLERFHLLAAARVLCP